MRRLHVLWRRARRTGRDLDLAGYFAGLIAAAMLLSIGIVGPTLDSIAAQRGHSGEAACLACT